MFRLCLFPGIKVSAEPLHENTIVNSPGQDWLLEVPAELQSKCTVTNNTTTTTTQARSSQHRLYDSPSQGSQQQLPSLTVMSLIKNNQFIVRTGLVFFFCCGSDEIVLLYISRSIHVQRVPSYVNVMTSHFLKGSPL